MKLKKITFALTGLVVAGIVGALPAYAAPSAPTRVEVADASEQDAGLSEAQVLVSWVASSGPDLVGHSVRLTDGANTVEGQELCVDTACSATFSGLSGGASYTASVTAIDSQGATASATSNPFIAKSIPEAPQDLAVEVVDGVPNLTWNEPSNTGGQAVLSYQISANQDFDGATLAGTSLSYEGTTLSPGTTYRLSLRAVNATGTSAAATFPSFLVPDVPEQPGVPNLEFSGQLARVSWQTPDSGGAQLTRYVVELYRNGEPLETVNNVDASLTQYDFTVSTSGAYQARVTAWNVIGASDPSSLSAEKTFGGGAELQSNFPVLDPAEPVNMQPGQSQSISASAPSGEPVTLRVVGSPSGACTLTSGVITAVSRGTCAITATAAATAEFDSGVTTATFAIKTAQSLAIQTIPAQRAPTTLAVAGLAVASSGLEVTYSVAGACTLESGEITLISSGTCTVYADQEGDEDYFAAPQVSATFAVSAGSNFIVGPIGTTPLPPVLLARPTLSGSAEAGSYIVASPGVWENSGSLEFTYRWLLCDAEIVAPT